LNWACEMHCPECERRLIDLVQDELAEQRQRCLH
jgi:hypothetical protein